MTKFSSLNAFVISLLAAGIFMSRSLTGLTLLFAFIAIVCLAYIIFCKKKLSAMRFIFFVLVITIFLLCYFTSLDPDFLLSTALMPLCLVFFYLVGPDISLMKIDRLIKLLINLSAFCILWDWILVDILGQSTTLRIRFDESLSYTNRPLGLFGQPTVNSCFIVILLMWRGSLQNRLSKRSEILPIIAVLVQGSFIGICLISSYLFFKRITPKFGTLIPTFFVSVCVLIALRVYTSGRGSLSYILDIADLYLLVINTFLSQVDLFDLFVTGAGEIILHPAPLFYASKIGILALSFSYFIIIFFWFRRSNPLIQRYSSLKGKFAQILLLVIANTHYPLFFFKAVAPIMALILASFNNIRAHERD